MPPFVKAPGGPWHRCHFCGSDSSEQTYAEVAALYATPEYLTHLQPEGAAAQVEALRSNVEWHVHYKHVPPDSTFLDVGCFTGAGLRCAAGLGFAVHGFDVVGQNWHGPHCTIAPVFHAGLFPRKYSHVLCREVLEHVEGWRWFLSELWEAAHLNGIVQVQTPRPCRPGHPMTKIVYQNGHLVILAPPQLQLALERTGFRILDRRFWVGGQAWLCQRMGGV
jgi:2-polyprenyl-3-methyl-5-hydroxy-6-metoxy-1,4-benzoquinol methylase